MVLQKGKCLLFLAVIALLIFSQTTAAQKIISSGTTFDESNSAKKEVEKPLVADSTAPSGIMKSAMVSFVENDSEADYRAEIKDIKYQFRKVETKKRTLDFDGAAIDELEKAAAEYSSKKDGDGEPLYVRETTPGRGFDYSGAFKQSLLFLGVQHGYAVLGQAKTRRALKHGPFFQDYFDSVKSLHGWDDGGKFFTNYIAHPLQGALTGHIYVQNSPQALREQFSMSGKYWSTRMKAFLWTAAWSTQFEIGPISQASIGNVGLKGKQTYEDIVVTPIAGTVMLVAEDAIDQYFIKAIERSHSNLYVKIFARMLLNPTRNFSNLLRFREPWYRDRAMER